MQEKITTLTSAVEESRRSYILWVAIVRRSQKEENTEYLNKNKLYFRTTQRASFIACIMALARFNDKTKSALKIVKVLSELEKISRFKPIASECHQILSEGEKNWKKIAQLRNSCFAHLDQITTEF